MKRNRTVIALIILFTGLAFALWMAFLTSKGLMDLQLAVTMWVTEVPIGLIVAWLTHLFDKQAYVQKTAVEQSAQPQGTDFTKDRTPRYLQIYGGDDLLKQLEYLHTKAQSQELLSFIAGSNEERNVSVAEQAAYDYYSRFLTLVSSHSSWDYTLRTKVHIIHDELHSGHSALRKGAIDMGRAHVEAALDLVGRLIVFLKSPLPTSATQNT